MTVQGIRTKTMAASGLAAATLLLGAASASAETITPTTFSDEYNVGAGCSLREAVQAANTDAAFGGCTTGSGADEIPLAAGTYQIALPGTETGNLNGSLDILSPLGVTISHTGPGATFIDGGGLDRVITVIAAKATISGVTVRNGNFNGCGCGVCEAVCPVEHCVTMVNESAFEDHQSQWEMWRNDKAAYKTWLGAKIGDKKTTVRSHGFRFRGQYEQELAAELDSGGIEITAGIPGENAEHKRLRDDPASTIVTGVAEAPGA